MKAEAICKSMPKLELHSHLNGCISEELLQKLTAENKSKQTVGDSWINWNPKPIRTLADCFILFKQIHAVVRTPEILHRVTTDVIQNFSKENVIYLELRTTPKLVHEISSKQIYLETVISAILKFKTFNPMIVKLLISIDREKEASDGDENVSLAIEYMKKYPDVVVGIDLSGDPVTGKIEWVIPLLTRAKDNGLRITCHLPEVINHEETDRLLAFDGVERLGHGLYIHPTYGGTTMQWEIIKSRRIPIEACITSNIVTGVSESVEKHYVRVLHSEGIPFVICTDDSGVFNTSLSEEYVKFLQIVPITTSELEQLCLSSISYSFASDSEKRRLRETIRKWWANPANVIQEV